MRVAVENADEAQSLFLARSAPLCASQTRSTRERNALYRYFNHMSVRSFVPSGTPFSAQLSAYGSAPPRTGVRPGDAFTRSGSGPENIASWLRGRKPSHDRRWPPIRRGGNPLGHVNVGPGCRSAPQLRDWPRLDKVDPRRRFIFGAKARRGSTNSWPRSLSRIPAGSLRWRCALSCARELDRHPCP